MHLIFFTHFRKLQIIFFQVFKSTNVQYIIVLPTDSPLYFLLSEKTEILRSPYLSFLPIDDCFKKCLYKGKNIYLTEEREKERKP